MAAVALGAAFLAVTATTSTHALMNAEKTTYLTFSRSVALPGVELSAGTYIFELVLPESEQHLVRVLSKDRSHVYLTAFTNMARRPWKLDRKQLVTFGEAPRGMAPPIKIWYPQDGTDGREFIYE
jgi:hypothetical protein